MSLAMADHCSSDGVATKLPYGGDVLLHRTPAFPIIIIIIIIIVIIIIMSDFCTG